MTRQIGDYGYQMWLCEYPGAVRADGALGQYILIVPDKDMVVVITECTLIDGRRQRRLVWNRLLPETGDQALVPGKDYKRLQKKQRSYQLPLVQGKAASSFHRNTQASASCSERTNTDGNPSSCNLSSKKW